MAKLFFATKKEVVTGVLSVAPQEKVPVLSIRVKGRWYGSASPDAERLPGPNEEISLCLSLQEVEVLLEAIRQRTDRGMKAV